MLYTTNKTFADPFRMAALFVTSINCRAVLKRGYIKFYQIIG